MKKQLAKVRCEICGREFDRIWTHLRIHNITFDEYKEQFPDALVISEGYRKKLSESRLGIPSPFKGKHHTEDSKQLIREGHLGMKYSEESKQKMSDNHPDVSGEKHPMYGKRGEGTSNWQGGISYLPYCIKFDDDLKERVREFFDRKCYICGKNEEENGQRLSVHHVNYDKMMCCNDVKPLFVPPCKKCHAKTLKDREGWEEFFTISLEYLTQGECFIPKENKKP